MRELRELYAEVAGKVADPLVTFCKTVATKPCDTVARRSGTGTRAQPCSSTCST